MIETVDPQVHEASDPKFSTFTKIGFNRAIKSLELGEDETKTMQYWWRTYPQKVEFISRYKEVVDSEDLPKMEREEAQKSYKATESEFENINKTMDSIIDRERSNYKIPIIKALDVNNKKATAYDKTIDLCERIVEFHENNGYYDEQILAICEILIEAKPKGNELKLIKQKFAQWGFEEVMTLMGYERILHKEEIETERTTTLDSYKAEKDELKAALQRDLWKGPRLSKWGRSYKHIKSLFAKYGHSKSIQRQMDTLFNIAIGKESTEGISTIAIMQSFEQMLMSITSLELMLSWSAEKDREDSEKENSD